jgi:uncharacterized Zn-binding protein involved in type VI secretion
MASLARLGHHARVVADAHGCPACPHTCTGPIVVGSCDVFVNGLPAAREGDLGIHAACCGPNIFHGGTGSTSVFINGKKALRKDDPTIHCGGVGKVIDGCPTVQASG